VAALTLVVDAVALASFNEERSGYALAARAAQVAGERPLVLFRVGEGDMGQFAFALKRRLPVAWMDSGLRRMAGHGPAVVLSEKEIFEDAVRTGVLSPETLARLRPIEEGVANEDVFLILDWAPASGGSPEELR
jgi:hypothetical protein